MDSPDHPQIYLVTPPDFELSSFPKQLTSVLDIRDIACVRLALASRDEDRLSRLADAVREIAHERDIAVVIDNHVALAERLGLDGVHLTDGARGCRAARKALGADAIVGAFCGTSKHDGMNAGEAGADYVAFGPVGASELGDGTRAPIELFQWWSEVIEVPVVAEGQFDVDTVAALAPVSDFLAIGEEIWREDDPASALTRLLAPLG